MNRRAGSAVTCLILLALVLLPASARAIGFHTPLAWQQRVPASMTDSLFVGQNKNISWIRDANHDFVDDLIDSTFSPGDTVRVILDLNQALTARQIQFRFGAFGRIQYISRILTTVFLAGVRVNRLDSLATSPDVAMVEWQPPVHLAVAYSTREIQARANRTYPAYSNSAESLGQTGVGVGIAILDDGVDEGHLSIPDTAHGFDALKFEDTNGNGVDDSCEGPPLGDGTCSGADDEIGDGTTDPNPCVTSGGRTTCQKHGTYVAGVALGRGFDDPTDQCAGSTTPPDESGLTANCTGTATGADLVDLRVCPDDVSDCSLSDVTEGLDWLAVNAGSLGIRVANLSFVVCASDDPTGMLPSLVDYIAESGVVVVAGHGNRDKCLTSNPACDPADPAHVNRRSLAPGVAPMALTVSATNDKNTFERHDDVAYSSGLEGPRCGFDPAAPDRAYLKPDIAAPGEGIWVPTAGTTSTYEPRSGTSLAAPHVAGAAAIVLGANRAMDAASACDLLMRTADPPSASVPYDPAVDPIWSAYFGMGIVNVYGALAAMNAGDVAFPSCVGDPGTSGSPCLLASPRQPWENDVDIVTDISPPVKDVANTIHASVQNKGAAEATVDVDFGIYIFGTGTRAFYHIGRQRKVIAAGATADVTQLWTPDSEGHECVQVAIRYGPDTIFWNNVTQRNMTVEPAGSMTAAPGAEAILAAAAPRGIRIEKDVRVENPFLAPAAFRVQTISSDPDFPCSAKPAQFTNDPATELPQNVHVSFSVPASANVKDSADCKVVVYARKAGATQEVQIGGVTLRGFEPKSCEIHGYVQDTKGVGVRGVRVAFARAIRPGTASFESVAKRVTSGPGGAFRAVMEAGVPYRVRLGGKSGSRDYVIAPACGSEPIRLTYGQERRASAATR